MVATDFVFVLELLSNFGLTRTVSAPTRVVQNSQSLIQNHQKSALMCSGVLSNFTEPNRIVVFDKHVYIYAYHVAEVVLLTYRMQ